MIMLTDDELTTLISGRYADAALKTSLDTVQRRADQRRRNGRIALGASLAVVAVLAGGAAAVALGKPAKTVTPAAAFTRSCADRYQEMISGRSDLVQLPRKLPVPVIDLHHDARELQLYATPSGGALKQIIVDCEGTVGGDITAHVTAATGTDANAGAIGEPTDYSDYAASFTDGSGALIGAMPSAVTAVTVTDAGGTPVPVTLAGDFFVAWTQNGDLTDAEVMITPLTGEPIQLDSPTALPATFDPASFGAACAAKLSDPSLGYAGPLDPVLQTTYLGDIYWIYGGSQAPVTAGCVFTSTATQHGLTLYTAKAPPSSAPVYGFRAAYFNTDAGAGLVVGVVPDDTTSVQIVTPDGQSVDALTALGLFVVPLPAHVFGNKAAKIIATSPSGTHTYTG